MKAKHLIALMLTAGISADISAAPNQKASQSYEYRVVGFSTETIKSPFHGINRMHDICNNAFPGRDARMCTDIEVIKTPWLSRVIPPVFARGWVQPIDLDHNLSCGDWSEGYFGKILSAGPTIPAGPFGIRLDVAGCFSEIFVTSCAPAP